MFHGDMNRPDGLPDFVGGFRIHPDEGGGSIEGRVRGWLNRGDVAHFIVHVTIDINREPDFARSVLSTACDDGRWTTAGIVQLTDTPRGRICPKCERLSIVPKVEPAVERTEPGLAAKAKTTAATTAPPPEGWSARLLRMASAGLAAVVFLAVVVVATPLTWIGLGLAAGIAYSGNPLLEAFWTGPLGTVAHAVGTVLFAGITAAVAAGAVRSRH